ncbi:MAG: tRNA (N6-isopentenyl adenosine(37)-C2)-methylthiotransferase MiaB [Cytophagales bacterium]|jgi:tRNA-2-methylthio-N6-dimethylallyladenosine synthase|nr:tRNA (N6-isopentenyl adenosine(37)-C2)-methylthiotransferase MiaB [Cytophagales bacterium]
MSKKFYIKTYGCQMNVADSELVTGILEKNNFIYVDNLEEADVILLNTCSIREKAENTLRSKIADLKKYKKTKIIGILGCMAERLGKDILQNFDGVDFCIGPDEYKNVPNAINEACDKKRNIYTKLSLTETYENFFPKRIHSNGCSAFVSIMRGCNNMCSYCVVPFTRGRERSRSNVSILEEISYLSEQNYREVTLLGQNVNSYRFKDVSFANLLEQIAEIAPNIRIRFMSSHPKDFSRDIIETMAKYQNICNHIHLPVQCGSDEVLKRMNRPYTREQYLGKIAEIREMLGEDCGLSTDILVGFCGETEKDHEQTLDLMEKIKFDLVYSFAYSERSGTHSAMEMKDNVKHEIKIRRLNEVIELQKKHSLERNKKEVGKVLEVLVEGNTKKSDYQWQGRTDSNKMVIFEAKDMKPGLLVTVKIKDCSSASLLGNV